MAKTLITWMRKQAESRAKVIAKIKEEVDKLKDDFDNPDHFPFLFSPRDEAEILRTKFFGLIEVGLQPQQRELLDIDRKLREAKISQSPVTVKWGGKVDVQRTLRRYYPWAAEHYEKLQVGKIRLDGLLEQFISVLEEIHDKEPDKVDQQGVQAILQSHPLLYQLMDKTQERLELLIRDISPHSESASATLVSEHISLDHVNLLPKAGVAILNVQTTDIPETATLRVSSVKNLAQPVDYPLGQPIKIDLAPFPRKELPDQWRFDIHYEIHAQKFVLPLGIAQIQFEKTPQWYSVHSATEIPPDAVQSSPCGAYEPKHGFINPAPRMIDDQIAYEDSVEFFTLYLPRAGKKVFSFVAHNDKHHWQSTHELEDKGTIVAITISLRELRHEFGDQVHLIIGDLQETLVERKHQYEVTLRLANIPPAQTEILQGDPLPEPITLEPIGNKLPKDISHVTKLSLQDVALDCAVYPKGLKTQGKTILVEDNTHIGVIVQARPNVEVGLRIDNHRIRFIPHQKYTKVDIDVTKLDLNKALRLKMAVIVADHRNNEVRSEPIVYHFLFTSPTTISLNHEQVHAPRNKHNLVIIDQKQAQLTLVLAQDIGYANAVKWRFNHIDLREDQFHDAQYQPGQVTIDTQDIFKALPCDSSTLIYNLKTMLEIDFLVGEEPVANVHVPVIIKTKDAQTMSCDPYFKIAGKPISKKNPLLITPNTSCQLDYIIDPEFKIGWSLKGPPKQLGNVKLQNGQLHFLKIHEVFASTTQTVQGIVQVRFLDDGRPSLKAELPFTYNPPKKSWSETSGQAVNGFSVNPTIGTGTWRQKPETRQAANDPVFPSAKPRVRPPNPNEILGQVQADATPLVDDYEPDRDAPVEQMRSINPDLVSRSTSPARRDAALEQPTRQAGLDRELEQLPFTTRPAESHDNEPAPWDEKDVPKELAPVRYPFMRPLDQEKLFNKLPKRTRDKIEALTS